MREKANDRPRIVETLQEKPSFLITSHNSPCGDAIGSELAMGFLLERLGKEVIIRNSGPVPRNLAFLPGADKILCGFELQKQPQVLILVDCANIDRVGGPSQELRKFDTIINIDHHVSNDYFGTLNYVDADAASTGEMIFPLFEELVGGVGQEEAACLYTSILTDTGSFHHAGTKPRTHEIAARLLSKGIDPSSIAREVYGNFCLASRKLLGLALSSIQLSEDGEIAWIKVTGEMYREAGGQERNAHDFIDYIYPMKDVRVSLLLRELDEKNVKVSFRSNLVDVNQIAQVFGGGGHQRAAGCTVEGTMADAEKTVVKTVQKSLDDEKRCRI
jgi:phosphoesterase RecJ-like protein